jgi:hypothetical protein
MDGMLLLSIQSFYGDVVGTNTGLTWSTGWVPLIVLAVIAALTFHTTILMLARAFNIKEIETFAKSEILQTWATAVMAFFLVVMVSSAMQLAASMIHGQLVCGDEVINIDSTDAESAMENAFDAIRCRLQSRASEVAQIQGALAEGSLTEFNRLNIGLSMFGITFFKGDWVGDWYEGVESKRIANNLATVLLIGLNAQSSVLQYIKANALHVFIPVGILLRSFYFTRSVGALFISVGIGMFFIFPVFFVLLDPGFTASTPPTSMLGGQQTPYCYATMSNTVSTIQSSESQGGTAVTNLAMEQLGEDLSKSYISLIIHPLVALFLTMAFVRYIMTVLGGDTYELTKMITKVV